MKKRILAISLAAVLLLAVGCAQQQSTLVTGDGTATPAALESATPPASGDPSPGAYDTGIFNPDDIAALSESYKTVGDYVTKCSPVMYYWYVDAVSGKLKLEMDCEGGAVSVLLDDIDGEITTINDQPEGQDDALNDAELLKTAGLAGIEWQLDEFDMFPTVRGIKLGDEKSKVLGAFLNNDTDGTSGVMYDITALNPGADASWVGEYQTEPGARSLTGDDLDCEDGCSEALCYIYTEVAQKEEWRRYGEMRFYINNGVVAHMTYTIYADE